MHKLKGLINLIRFELPFSAGVCVVMGPMFALGKFASINIIALGFITVFLISASILVLNDYFDLETDKINAPNRPIPSGLVSPKEALIFSILLFLLGLYLSFLISMPAVICIIILAVIGYLYNSKFKKNGLFGNILVSISVGMTFIYGGITVGDPFNKTVLFFGLIAALIDLGEEIAADSMDAEGDKLINSTSLAIKYGRQFALKVSTSIFFFVVLLSIIPFALNWFTNIYIFPITVMDAAIIYSSINLLKSKNDEGRKYIRLLYLGATFGLLIFLIMGIIGI